MDTTCDFLDALKYKTGIASDFGLAEYLQITRSTVSAYRLKRCTFSDETALHVADLLGLNRGYVLACVHAEKNRNDDKAYDEWEKIAALLPIKAA